MEDMGDPRATFAGELLLESIERQSGISPFWLRVAKTDVMQHLCNRLNLVAQWSVSAPARLSGDSPILLFGLPRTGSTFLQNLMSLDESLRTPRFWEAFEPLPPPGADLEADRHRQEMAATNVRVRDHFASEAQGFYRIDVFLPIECAALLRNSFTSHTYDVIGPIRSYLDWLRGADLGWAYEEFRDTLGLWSSVGPHERTWLLKAPSHTFHLEAVVRAFPGVRLVQLHREPEEVFRSAARLLYATRSTGGSSSDRESCLEETASDWSSGLAAAVSWREKTSYPVLDVSFRELTSDPLAVVQGLYSKLGMDWSSGLENKISRQLAGGLPSSMISPRHDPVRSSGEHAAQLAEYRARFADLL